MIGSLCCYKNCDDASNSLNDKLIIITGKNYESGYWFYVVETGRFYWDYPRSFIILVKNEEV